MKSNNDQARWQAVVERRPEEHGAFVYGVVTTGIYCRPTCASRRPHEANVQFFDSWRHAEQQGFRPCRRCRPQESSERTRQAELVEAACRMIETALRGPSLQELAGALGLSPSHFHRLFSRTLGVTPKQYEIAHRRKRMRDQLKQSESITEAVYASGYTSSSRFYETADHVCGMKPSDYRHGGRSATISYAIAPSSLGWVLIAATEKGVCRIDLDGEPQALEIRLRAEFPQAICREDEDQFREIVAQVVNFLNEPRTRLHLPLDVQGTVFQHKVWSALRDIAPGSTASYAEIARRLGKPKAARAVARACAANRLAVAVPCHRVVRGDGGLGGYRWGLHLKKTLLNRESEEQRIFKNS